MKKDKEKSNEEVLKEYASPECGAAYVLKVGAYLLNAAAEPA